MENKLEEILKEQQKTNRLLEKLIGVIQAFDEMPDDTYHQLVKNEVNIPK